MKILLNAILLLLIFSGCDDNNPAQQVEKKIEKELKKEPNSIALQDIMGEKVEVGYQDGNFTFNKYENRVVLLNLFTDSCLPCKAEIPSLNGLQERHKDNLKIINILLSEESLHEDIFTFISKNIVKIPKNTPLMIIFNRDGVYSRHYTDTIPVEMIEVDIKRLI